MSQDKTYGVYYEEAHPLYDALSHGIDQTKLAYKHFATAGWIG